MKDYTQMKWKGRPVEDLSREEAIEALKQVARLYDQTLERKSVEREMFALIASVRAT
jgi:hypothetical protein